MNITKAIVSQFTKHKGKKTDKRLWLNIVSKFVGKLAVAIILLGLAYVILYPLIYCISQAIRLPSDMYDPRVIYIPRHFTWQNFKDAWSFLEYPRILMNTVNVSLWPTLLQLCTCALAGYGLARFKFKGKGLIFALVILTFIVPPQTISVTTYTTFRYFDPFYIMSGLNLVGVLPESYIDITDTLWSFILPALFASGLKSGLFIFVYRQFFRGVPKELEEAAYIDGCGSFATFLKIIVPNAIPAFVTVFLLSLVWYYNDYYTVPLFLPQTEVLSSSLSDMFTNMTTVGGLYSGVDELLIYPIWRAGIILYILPLLVVFLVFQRKFTESIARSGIVG